jgi:phosphohistidine phosphatase
MEIYLVQHAQAESKERHPERPLTPTGRSEAICVADRLAELDLGVGAIWHSGKLRAKQTVEIFAVRLYPMEGVVEHEGLAPNDDPALAANALAGTEATVMLVGHLPHLSRLTSLLVTGDPTREIVAFRNAGVVCLGKEGQGWPVRWMITPDQV